ncbi:MAG: hypothetical protein ACJ75A_10515 [Actinomycetes bacterium]
MIEDTLDGAPDGEPVLELARRATHALAAHSVADRQRRLARERLIAATPALQAPPDGQAPALVAGHRGPAGGRGSTEAEALLVPKVALACFQAA